MRMSIYQFVTDNDRYQIRLREITVILCILFGTHRIGIPLIIVPATGLLYNLFPGFNQINLAGCLGFNGMCDCLKRTDIYQFVKRAPKSLVPVPR